MNGVSELIAVAWTLALALAAVTFVVVRAGRGGRKLGPLGIFWVDRRDQ